MVIVGVLLTSMLSAQSIQRMEAIDGAIERRMPRRLKEFSLSFADFRRALGRKEGAPDGHMKAVYAQAGGVGIDLAILATIAAVGTLTLLAAPQLFGFSGLAPAGLQLILLAVVVLMAAPAFRDLVRRLSRIIDLLSTEIEHRSALGKRFGKRVVAGVMRSLLIAVTALVVTLGAVVVVTSLPTFTPYHLIVLVPPVVLFGWFFWGAFEQVHHRFEASVAQRAAGQGASPPLPAVPAGPTSGPTAASRSSDGSKAGGEAGRKLEPSATTSPLDAPGGGPQGAPEQQ
jgi:hypothetical protein